MHLQWGRGICRDILSDMLKNNPKINRLARQPYLSLLLVAKGSYRVLPTRTYDLVLQ